MGHEKPNITLVVVDSLRNDFADPIWDVLKDRGFVRYGRAIAPSNWTMPSHASMFTGVYPSVHGVRETEDTKIPNIAFDLEQETFMDTLSDMGYTINWFTANDMVSPEFGLPKPDLFVQTRALFSFRDKKILPVADDDSFFVRPFKHLVNFISDVGHWLAAKSSRFSGFLEKSRSSLFRLFKERTWPRKKGGDRLVNRMEFIDGPLFNFVNLMEVHEPYLDFYTWDPCRPAEEMANLRKEYAREVEITAGNIKHIVEKLEDFSDNNLIMVVSDHGQLLGERRDLIFHRYGVHEEIVRVPLFVKYPKGVETLQGEGWISLVKLKELVETAASGKLDDDGLLFSPVVFSETFGYHGGPRGEVDDNVPEEHRLAVYENDSKGIYHVDGKELESTMHFGDRQVSEEGLHEKAEFFLDAFGV